MALGQITQNTWDVGSDINPIDIAFRGLNQGIQAVNSVQDMGLKNKAIADEEQRKADFSDLFNNHDPQKVLAIQAKYPEFAGKLKPVFDAMDSKTKEQRYQKTAPVYSAMLNGRNDIASRLLNDQATALENSGGDPAEIEATRALAKSAIDSPGQAKTQLSLVLSGTQPEHFSAHFSNLSQTENQNAISPYQVKTEQAQADKYSAEAAVKGAEIPYAGDTAAAKLANEQNKGYFNEQDLKVKKEDLALKQQANTASLNDKLTAKQKAQIEEANLYKKGLDDFDSMATTLDEIAKHPAVVDSNGFVRQWASFIPESDAQDLATKFETLDAKKFMAGVQVFVGKGALSDAEGSKLVNQMFSLKPGMKKEKMLEAIEAARPLIEKGKRFLEEKYKAMQDIGALPDGTIDREHKTLADKAAKSPDAVWRAKKIAEIIAKRPPTQVTQ